MDRGIAVTFLGPGARRGWVVSTTPRPLYSWERPGTHYTGGWVGTRAGLDVCEKSRPYRDSIPGPSSPYPVVTPTELPGLPIELGMRTICPKMVSRNATEQKRDARLSGVFDIQMHFGDAAASLVT
jgi:hypothetical protein